MAMFQKILYHYLIGVLLSANLVTMIILFDYYINGYLQYPELSNFIKVITISGAGFGLTHFAFTLFHQSDKTKTN